MAAPGIGRIKSCNVFYLIYCSLCKPDIRVKVGMQQSQCNIHLHTQSLIVADLIEIICKSYFPSSYHGFADTEACPQFGCSWDLELGVIVTQFFLITDLLCGSKSMF